MIIDRSSFIADGTNYRGGITGTVLVDTGHGMEPTRAVKNESGSIYAAGFVGRYRTSPKPWAAAVSSTPDREHVYFGRDERSGRFNKRNMISFEPETFAKLTNAKYWAAL